MHDAVFSLNFLLKYVRSSQICIWSTKRDCAAPNWISLHWTMPSKTNACISKSSCEQRIVLVGDRYVRGCSEKILNLYRDSYSVTGLAKPNAFLNSVTALTNFRTENLKKKKDVVIVCGGARNIGRSDTKRGLCCCTHVQKELRTQILLFWMPSIILI